MSIRLIDKVLDLDLPPSEKLVLVVFAEAANDETGESWWSHEKMARRCSKSKRGFEKVLKNLLDGGWLKKEKKYGRANHYFLTLDNPKSVKIDVIENQKASKRTQENVKTDAFLYIEEPSVEPKTPAAKKTLPAAQRKKDDHRWFTAWWCFSFQQITRTKYAYTKKDAGQIKKLLSMLGLEETVARACVYLSLPDSSRFPRGAPTVGGLLLQINEVTGFNRALEDRFLTAGLLPDLDIDNELKNFKPWEIIREPKSATA